MFSLYTHVHIEKTAPPPGGHVFRPTMTIFELVRDIYTIDKTNVLTKFHEDWTKNVTFRVFTCCHYIHIEKTAPPPGGINRTNVLTKLYENQTINVASGVFTRQMLTAHDARRTKGDHKSSP
ncbi:hypothetical protein DPMN_147523 [Dreissena polymorpha]|uniref:Uncharacterized protein n=1 Tax=Dreissena polymorpha TaxID=45954 RepID=A0A9D4FA15_DREPO|nr:hypothetical protein DPMN_147523 [Dreissena polymorpha]